MKQTFVRIGLFILGYAATNTRYDQLTAMVVGAITIYLFEPMLMSMRYPKADISTESKLHVNSLRRKAGLPPL